jgi:hypothetical protein
MGTDRDRQISISRQIGRNTFYKTFYCLPLTIFLSAVMPYHEYDCLIFNRAFKT